MALTPGTRFGPYEVLAPVGAGGMGEVYRARDTRLDRTVAIKVLPAHVATDPDLRQRFEREARAVAALNHPHICTLHDVGQQDGIDFLVMEYLEGETLASRLEKGALPLDQGLQYAIQMADALDRAHRQGIVHRDLKPSNIMLTKSGVKLLDFGLAKLTAAAPFGIAGMTAAVTQNAPLTGQGTILGTLQYMAPEQVEGKEADARGDIFAFGAIVYEMATGKRAFEGQSQASVIAKILEHDPPPMSTVQAMTPPALDRVVKRCLAKDPDDRWQTARDLEVELKWIAEGGGQITPRPSAPVHGVRALGRRPLILSLGMLLIGAVVTGVGIWALKPTSSAGPQPVSRLVITLPGDQQFTGTSRRVVALSPLGTHLLYVANNRLYLRAIDQLTATPIQGTESAVSLGSVNTVVDPFFSSDGKWIGFWQAGELRKVAITGGAPVKLSEPLAATMGASWGADDTIVYGRGTAGIWRVSGQGGTAERLVAVDEKKGETAHGPQFLPGGRAVLFTLATGPDWNEAQIVVQLLDSRERKVVLRGGRDARYVETGHLVYARAGTLLAVPFDLGRLEVTGGPVPLVEGVAGSGGITGATHFSLSGNGSLVYIPGGSLETAQRRLVWVSRNSGAEQPLTAPLRAYGYPRISPDGRRVAVELDSQIWLFDLTRDTLTRFTFEGTVNQDPAWTPDGKRIAFRSNKEGPVGIFWQMADGSGGLERLTSGEYLHTPRSWSADGQLLTFTEDHSTTLRDIWVLTLGDRKAQPFLRTPFTETASEFSPEGRWLAYVSDESGRREIYVQPYPGPGGKWQISTGGGTEPLWSRNGLELFYRSGNRIMAVETATQPSFVVGKPRLLFEGQYSATFTGTAYDVSTDGQRFLMVKEPESASGSTAQIIVVQNWFEELKRLVPTK